MPGFFSCFRNPPNSEMDYRTFNVPCGVVILTRANTRGGWAHRQRVSTTFQTKTKQKTVSCAPDRVWTSAHRTVSPTLQQSINWLFSRDVIKSCQSPIFLPLETDAKRAVQSNITHNLTSWTENSCKTQYAAAQSDRSRRFLYEGKWWWIGLNHWSKK